MPTILVLLLVAVLAVLVWLVMLLKTRTGADEMTRVDAALQTLKSELISTQMEGLVSLRESLDSANRLLNERLAEGTETLDRRLELFGEIEKKLTQLEIQARAIQEVGQNIQSLSELLKPPRLRGGLGELLLENLLSQILPNSLYTAQYRFPDGHRVDAVVKLGERLLPIDSKFPLETFQHVLSGEDADQAARNFTRHDVAPVVSGVGAGMQICVADLNADGRPDIAVSGKTGTWVLINEGLGPGG